jgi:hypothetical protein
VRKAKGEEIGKQGSKGGEKETVSRNVKKTLRKKKKK